jgi:cysteinyl-tRNA synthetase
MQTKTVLALAGSAIFLAGGSLAPLAARAAVASPTTMVAQAEAPAAAPMTREEMDARTETCVHYKNAFRQFDEMKREVAQLQNDFAATDDIRPKLDEMYAQMNDAQTTARVRSQGCPRQRQR